MRKLLIAGNWKMHGSQSQVRSLIEGIHQGTRNCISIDIFILPTYVHLMLAQQLLQSSAIKLGAQNLYPGSQGAFTGEVSGPMLADIGCQYVLVGHSERRTLFHEDLSSVAAKFKAAVEAGLQPILCVGETRLEREQDKTEQVIAAQLQSVVEEAGAQAFQQAVIAYEPVWAIGTGLTATPSQAQDAHDFIRHFIAKNNVDLANTIRILYGGSMKMENAASLLAMPDIDGGLIGGASLDSVQFSKICEIAQCIK